MASLLIAESGSTKTDWCLIAKSGKTTRFKTPGINPNLQKPADILAMLKKELNWKKRKAPDAISFYGAGTSLVQNQKELAKVLKTHFDATEVKVQTDMLAAARGLAGNLPGVVCILGTGSNSCYYDGRKIKDNPVSLGYIAGDEGSGNHMGKRVLQYYAYNTFDTELRMAFEMYFGDDISAIISTLYKEPYPNRYLAGFVKLLAANRGHFMVENIIEDCLNDFFHHHIIKYRQSLNSKIHFTGSVAYLFRDVIENLCSQYELSCGIIEQSPLDGLIMFHKSTM